MNILPIVSFIVIAVVVLAIIRLWLNKLEEKTQNSELIAWLRDVSTRLESSTARVDQKLDANLAMFNNRLDSASTVMSQLQRTIGEFSEIGRSMQDLQQFLQSPKLRGNIGEQVLKELLAQYFPPDAYEFQYSFKNGDKVDAVIKTSHGCIPIDSKFPLENYRKLVEASSDEDKLKIRKEFIKDVKKHINDIASKYILVSESTCDYALMYIPSEAIYYEIIHDAELFDYSGHKKVLPVSPISFYAYMKAILMSFEGQRIQTQAREILSLLKGIKKDYDKLDESLAVLNKHIVNSYNQNAQVTKQFLSLGQKLSTTHLIPQKLDKKDDVIVE